MSPRRASRELAQETSIASSLVFVLAFALFLALVNLVSYLHHEYPPQPEILQVWVAAWGEFAMLPVIKFPPESYRLLMAIIMVPLVFATWILMAGTGRLLSMLFHGQVQFEQYLNLFAFSFITFWLFSIVLDSIYSGFLDPYIVPALKMEYGPLARNFVLYYPQVMYPLVLGTGGVYSALAAHSVERFSAWKAAVIGALAAFWGIFMTAFLLR